VAWLLCARWDIRKYQHAHRRATHGLRNCPTRRGLSRRFGRAVALPDLPRHLQQHGLSNASSQEPTDPFVSNQPDADPDREANRITNPVAAALAAVLDLRYRIALASIRAALSRDRTKSTDLPTRTKYVGWAFDEMKPFLLGGSSALARQPLKSSPGGVQTVAAPTFNLDGFALPDDSAALEQALLDLHRQAAIAINAVLAQQIDLSTKSILRKMQQADELRYPTLQA
jgi:hypothetical protein